MMEYFLIEMVSYYAPAILEAIILIIAGLLAMAAKKFISPYLQNKVVMVIAKNVVMAVEQTYKELHGEDKLNKALESFSEMLAAKHIKISANEMRVMLEAALAEFNGVFSGNAAAKQLTD